MRAGVETSEVLDWLFSLTAAAVLHAEVRGPAMLSFKNNFNIIHSFTRHKNLPIKGQNLLWSKWESFPIYNGVREIERCAFGRNYTLTFESSSFPRI